MNNTNKFKYILSGILAFQIAASLHAGPEGQSLTNKPAFQGFHIGGNIGYGQGTGHFKSGTNIKNAAGNSIWTDSSKTKLGFDGVDGGLGLGYMHRLEDFVLGVAFDANWSNASGKGSATGRDNAGNTLSANYKARLKNSLQLYAKFGYVIREKVMPFLGLGWDNSEWQQTVNIKNDAGFQSNLKKHHRINAGLWKFGFDVLATKNVIVGFEYTGTLGGSKSYTLPASTGFGNSNTKFKPQYNKFAFTTKFVF